MSLRKLKTVLFFAAISSFGLSCSVNVEYEAPRDQIADMCSGTFVNTPSTCVDSNITSMYIPVQNNNALILVTEPGYIDATASNLAALKNTFPPALAPHFRTLQNNILSAYISKMLQVSGQKYGRIFLVRSNTESKSLLLETIKRATNAHNKVDLLLAIHGNRGSWLLDPNLSENYALNSSQLVSFANSQLTQTQRNKIRAVFSTACYGDSPTYYPYYMPSMSAAISQVFPYSVTYGSTGVNWAPMHRDFTAFEYYYSGNPFYAGILYMGNYVLNYDASTGAARTALNFPTILGRGCWSNGLWTDCANQAINMGSFEMNSYMVSESNARISSGVYGNIYGIVANTCVHPSTGAKVPEGSVYSYYTQSYLPWYSEFTCSQYRVTLTCLASGWSAPVPASGVYATCTKPARCSGCMEP